MHVRCPHCRNPIDLVDPDPLVEIQCPTCGSSFDLVAGNTTETFRSGTRRLAHFEMVRELGIGKFGSVWLAHDTELDRTVAIKIPRKGALDAEETRLFLRDARAAAQLKHPHIVGVHEVGRDGDTVYIVSDHVEGVNLRERLSGGRLSFRESAELVAKVAEALEHAHRSGVVHRDLKPSNIMLDDAGDPHVIDFGLAKRETGEITMTVDGHVLGTPAYMSPEQAAGQGHGADARSDVYSLGVILYELLTGEVPFRGEKQMILWQIQHDEPSRPRKLNAKIPRDLETICLKAMAKEPGRRYPSAVKLADDLQRYLSRQPIQARPVGQAERLWRWSRRNPLVAGLASTALLLLVLVAVVGTVGYVQTSLALNREEAARRHAEAEQQRADDNARRAEVARHEAEDNAAQLEKQLYYNRIALAQREWDRANIARVEQLLDLCPTSLRAWEWHRIRRLCHLNRLELVGHANTVFYVSWSPDGNRVATASYDGTARIFDADTGANVLTLDCSVANVGCVNWSPDGKLLATAGGRIHLPQSVGCAQIWDAASGAEIRKIEGHRAGVTSVRFSPDGARLATASGDGTARIWDAATGKELLKIAVHPLHVLDASWSPDGEKLATVAGLFARNNVEFEAKLWDTKTGDELLAFKGLRGAPHRAVWSPDGRRLATAGYYSRCHVFDTTTGEVVQILDHPHVAWAIAWSPSGNYLVTGSHDSVVRIWRADQDAQVADFRSHTDPVYCVAWSPDGKKLASAGGNWENLIRPQVKIWDFDRRDGTLELARASFVAWAPDSRRFAVAASSQPLRIRDAVDNEEILAPATDFQASCALWSADGKRLAAGADDGTVQIWDTSDPNALLTLDAHSAAVVCLSWLSGGNRLATAGRDGVAVVWDTTNGTQIATQAPGQKEQSAAQWSPDGRLLATGNATGTLKIWDRERGVDVLTIDAHEERITGIAWNPNCKKLATSSRDFTAKIWNTESGAEVLVLRGHADPVDAVAWSPDGSRVATGSNDFTVRIWDPDTGTDVLTIPTDGIIPNWISWSVDGSRIAYGGGGAARGRILDGSALTDAERESLSAARNSTPSAKQQPLSAMDRIALMLHARATQLNNDAWNVVQGPEKSESAYANALKQAEEAHRLAPREMYIINTLGAAQYRAGEYEKALATLERSSRLNSRLYHSPIPPDLAFIAMTHHRLGNADEARSTLRLLADAIKQPRWQNDKESHALFGEAESLIGKVGENGGGP